MKAMLREDILEHYRFIGLLKASTYGIENNTEAIKEIQDIIANYLDVLDTSRATKRKKYIEKSKDILTNLDNIMADFKSKDKVIMDDIDKVFKVKKRSK